jgi:predicted transcriptional regulator
MRINARLDDSRSQKLDFLARTTRLSTSDIVKQALDVYYEQVRSRRPAPAAVLAETGFIGCGEASPELSDNYKEEARRLAATKHGHR